MSRKTTISDFRRFHARDAIFLGGITLHLSAAAQRERHCTEIRHLRPTPDVPGGDFGKQMIHRTGYDDTATLLQPKYTTKETKLVVVAIFGRIIDKFLDVRAPLVL